MRRTMKERRSRFSVFFSALLFPEARRAAEAPSRTVDLGTGPGRRRAPGHLRARNKTGRTMWELVQLRAQKQELVRETVNMVSKVYTVMACIVMANIVMVYV